MSIAVRGKPHVTDSGAVAILATSIPRMMSPCLHPIPATDTGDASDHPPDRHVELLANPSLIDIIVARSHLIEAIEDFLKTRDFRRVYTPILAASAGGATARPFKTTATEFSDRELALRISPELWLKRLVVGGMDRVFEIGPSFRNEGLDKTHNPEFTTCEFYATNWTLEKLLTETQAMINDAAKRLEILDADFRSAIGKWPGEPWPRIDFIPAINEALGLDLPDLSSSYAREELLQLFKQKNLPLPTTPTLPRLLDKLASIYIEPHCSCATWIINTPECLSPLAKSFPHPELPHQRVAARGELFVQGKEIVNCYEEENSPIEQKRKFLDQQKYARLPEEGETTEGVDDEAMSIDDDYIRCLEWGLPPTGGWGCGIDRLLMLMLGKSNIKNVLTFGNLRAVTRGAEKVPADVEASPGNSGNSSTGAGNESTIVTPTSFVGNESPPGPTRAKDVSTGSDKSSPNDREAIIAMTRTRPVDSEAPLEQDKATESKRPNELGMSTKAWEESPDIIQAEPVHSGAPSGQDSSIDSDRPTEPETRRKEGKQLEKATQEELEKKFAYLKL